MSIAKGLFSWQCIDENFICLTIIDWEELTTLCRLHTFLIMLKTEFFIIYSVAWHDSLVLDFIRLAIACP